MISLFLALFLYGATMINLQIDAANDELIIADYDAKKAKRVIDQYRNLIESADVIIKYQNALIDQLNNDLEQEQYHNPSCEMSDPSFFYLPEKRSFSL